MTTVSLALAEVIGQSAIIFSAMRFSTNATAVVLPQNLSAQDSYSLGHLLDPLMRVELLETPMLIGVLQTSIYLNGVEELQLH